uniref:L1 transposable element RRM domain-containing protein n=1 Tax=Poecilia formosa TaxID=48698 RepID=A0A096LS14_POEFO
KASSVKQCEIFFKMMQDSHQNSPTCGEDANMATIAEVLEELKPLRSDFGAKLGSTDERLTGMASTMSALEAKVSEVKQNLLNQAAHMEQAEARIAEAKTDDLENRGRRKNRIREGAEGRQPLFYLISNMLPKWLELAPDKLFTLERVPRTPASGKPNQGRAVLICFLKFPEKEFVYREARKKYIIQDGAKITFTQDLSAETVRIRRGFHPVVKLFVDIGAFRGFQHNPCKLRILYCGKIHLFSKPQEAEKFY